MAEDAPAAGNCKDEPPLQMSHLRLDASSIFAAAEATDTTHSLLFHADSERPSTICPDSHFTRSVRTSTVPKILPAVQRFVAQHQFSESHELSRAVVHELPDVLHANFYSLPVSR